eukprot:TRINITY_DN9473_c0_g1_i5.p1 TRINITY_DN9473_c0_g1~~TRINITY_DN9473_c0_g1_i5.p1  ORF type:complete len:965 (+),score=261.80 TRINITY_DN9473_c0_g1_i5:139-2895(+)
MEPDIEDECKQRYQDCQAALKRVLGTIKQQPERKDQLMPVARALKAAATKCQQLQAKASQGESVTMEHLPDVKAIMKGGAQRPPQPAQPVQRSQVQQSAPPTDNLINLSAPVEPSATVQAEPRAQTASVNPSEGSKEQQLQEAQAMLAKNQALLDSFGNISDDNDDDDDDGTDDEIDLAEWDDEFDDKPATPEAAAPPTTTPSPASSSSTAPAPAHSASAPSSSRQTVPLGGENPLSPPQPPPRTSASGSAPAGFVQASSPPETRGLDRQLSEQSVTVEALKLKWQHAAQQYQKLDEHEQMKMCLRTIRQLDKGLEHIKAGHLLDMNKLPSSPPDARFVKPEDPNAAAFQEILDTINAQMDEAASLGQRYQQQGELERAGKLLQIAERMQRDSKLVEAMRAKRQSVPVLNYRDFTFAFQPIDLSVLPSELCCDVIRLIGVVPPSGFKEKDINLYTRLSLPYPDEHNPQKFETGPVAGSISPNFEQTSHQAKFERHSHRDFERYIRRKHLHVEVYHHKGALASLFSKDIRVATGRLPLKELQAKHILHTCIDLTCEASRAKCKVELKLRLRKPVLQGEAEQISCHWGLLQKTGDTVETRLTQVLNHEYEDQARKFKREQGLASSTGDVGPHVKHHQSTSSLGASSALPTVAATKCLSILRRMVEESTNALAPYAAQIKARRVPPAAKKHSVIKQNATKRYKALHASAFKDDASKQRYVTIVQKEIDVYEALVTELSGSTEQSDCNEARVRLQLAQAELQRLGGVAAKSATSEAVSALPPKPAAASQTSMQMPKVEQINSHKYLSQKFAEIDEKLRPHSAAMLAGQPLPPEVQPLAKDRVRYMKQIKVVEAKLQQSEDMLAAMKTYVAQLQQDHDRYLALAKQLKTAGQKDQVGTLLKIIGVIRSEIDETEHQLAGQRVA